MYVQIANLDFFNNFIIIIMKNHWSCTIAIKSFNQKPDFCAADFVKSFAQQDSIVLGILIHYQSRMRSMWKKP